MEVMDTGIFGRMFGAAEMPRAEGNSAENSTKFQSRKSEEPCDMNGSCNQPVGEFPTHTPIAMAYVPFQQWEKTYDDAVALSRGTIFPSLDKPFLGEEAVRNVRKR